MATRVVAGSRAEVGVPSPAKRLAEYMCATAGPSQGWSSAPCVSPAPAESFGIEIDLPSTYVEVLMSVPKSLMGGEREDWT